MTVGELLARISSRELSEWAAFERVEGPLGGTRGDVQAAVVAATVANANRPKNKSAAKVTDFLPDWGQRRDTPDDMWAKARALNAAMGGTEADGSQS